MCKIDEENSTCSAHVSCSCHTVVVQGDWTVAFCWQLFLLPGPKAVEVNSTIWMQPNSDLNSNIVLILILNSVYVLYFNLNCVFLCFLFFVFPSIFRLFPLEFWSKSKLILIPSLHFIILITVSPFCLICPFFFLRFLFSFFPSFFLLFVQLSFWFHVTFLFLFLSWSSRCSNLAIT